MTEAGIMTAKEHFTMLEKCIIFARTIFLAGLVSALKKRLTLPKMMELLDSKKKGERPLTEEDERYGDLVNSSVVRIYKKKDGNGEGICLLRSLVLFRALRKRGVSVIWKTGVVRDGEDLKGHSWLEAGGRHLWDSSPGISYNVTWSYPPERHGTDT